MVVGIVGSRDFYDYEYLCKIMNNIHATTIVSGDARGADSLGERFATTFGIPLIKHIPNWDLYGKSAGMIRNKLIVADADMVVAFWDDVSTGTKNSIDLAKKTNKKLVIVHYKSKKIELVNID